MAVSDRVRVAVEPAVAELGLELVDLVHAGAVLRLTVDRDGGVDLEAITRAARAVSAALDAADPIGTHYTLEVSSPGVERPLRTPQQFRRAVGSEVSVRTVAPTAAPAEGEAGPDGERRVTGTLVSADDDEIVVAPEGADPRHLRYDEIDRARTVFAWGPAPKPGGPRRGGARRPDAGAEPS